MEIVLTIPDEVASELQQRHSGASVSRRLLELIAIKLYEADVITGRQVREMLGFDSREELYSFFKANDVSDDYTIEDLERDKATLTALLNRQ